MSKTIYDVLKEFDSLGYSFGASRLRQWLDDAAKDKLANDAEAVAKTQRLRVQAELKRQIQETRKGQCSHNWGLWETMSDLHKERMCNICGKRQKQIEDYPVKWAAWTDSLCIAAGWKSKANMLANLIVHSHVWGAWWVKAGLPDNLNQFTYERRCMQCDAKETCIM